MATRNEQGDYEWMELMSPDPAAAKAFYRALFEWTDVEVPMEGPGGVYHLFTKNGQEHAGMMDLRALPQAGPPMWMMYFKVDDVDAAAARATAAGGSVLMPPSDVPMAGRLAVLADPHGAVFGIIKPAPRPA